MAAQPSHDARAYALQMRHTIADLHASALRGRRTLYLVLGYGCVVLAFAALAGAVLMLLHNTLPAAGGAAGAGLFLAGMGALQLWVAAALHRPVELVTTGIEGRVRILELIPARLSFRVQGSTFARTGLRCEVTVPGSPPYVVDHAEFPPATAMAHMGIGAEHQVFVDRSKPNRLLIDWPSEP